MDLLWLCRDQQLLYLKREERGRVFIETLPMVIPVNALQNIEEDMRI